MKVILKTNSRFPNNGFFLSESQQQFRARAESAAVAESVRNMILPQTKHGCHAYLLQYIDGFT